MNERNEKINERNEKMNERMNDMVRNITTLPVIALFKLTLKILKQLSFYIIYAFVTRTTWELKNTKNKENRWSKWKIFFHFWAYDTQMGQIVWYAQNTFLNLFNIWLYDPFLRLAIKDDLSKNSENLIRAFRKMPWKIYTKSRFLGGFLRQLRIIWAL